LKRRLWLLNVVLAGLLGLTCWRLRENYLQARVREQRLLGQAVPAAGKPLVTPTPAPQPVAATSYIDIAQKLLFSRDRNPTVVIEVAPPKPMPPLPLAHGLMAFGDEPTLILSEKAGARQRGYRPGETIGEFKLIGVHDGNVTFEWDGQQIEKRLDEMLVRGAAPPAPDAAAAANTANPLPPTAPGGTTVIAPEAAKAAPGVELTNQEKACNPGDTSPPGSVVDGMRKVVNKTPFGDSCRWVPVK
jgi:hypothetical protein